MINSVRGKGKKGEGRRGEREVKREFSIFPNPLTMIHDITQERKGGYLRSGKILDIR